MQDLKSYDKIWKITICPLIEHYMKLDFVKLNGTMDEVKQRIWTQYVSENEKCRTYMDDAVKNLDRHKVAACYMIALLIAEPFSFYNYAEEKNSFIVVTEQLAISVGLAILRSFILCKRGRKNEERPEEELIESKKVFKNGFSYPNSDEVDHGNYRDNFAIELYFTRMEKCYNILSLSHTLYLLERYNILHWKLLNTNR